MGRNSNFIATLIINETMQMKDTTQVILANGGASSLTMIDSCNQILTMVSISLAIIFTIYKFYKLSKK